jgi:hypothetical protein
MSTARQAEAATMKQSSFCSPVCTVFGQRPIAELRKVQNPALHLASRHERRNRANTVIVLCSLAILILVLGLLELHIRRLTTHSALSLSTAVRFSFAWRTDPVRWMRREAR